MSHSKITLSAWLKAEHLDQDLRELIEATVNTCIIIALRVREGALGDVLGATNNENIQGETQKKLDVIANDLLKKSLMTLPQVKTIASEEEETVVASNENGRYIIAFDPLDGSSNIDVNGQIGTIFTIYPARIDFPANSELQFQQQGRAQVCAGYVLYGAATLCMITVGRVTHCFTLNESTGEFLITSAELQIPQDTQEYSVNSANQRFWNSNFKNYISDLVNDEAGPRQKRYNMRWNGSMVGDIHRTLLRGGIFLYPSDNRNPQQPAKLRLLYEANPMALLIENAGGKACDEQQAILEIIPESLHQRVAVIMGSAHEVDVCMDYLKRH